MADPTSDDLMRQPEAGEAHDVPPEPSPPAEQPAPEQESRAAAEAAPVEEPAEAAPTTMAPETPPASPFDRAPSPDQPGETALSTMGSSLSATFAPLWERIGPFVRAYGLYVLIGILVLFVLFLPPISLLERLGVIGYTTLDAANASVSDPAGITVSVDPQTFTGKLRVQLDVIPQERLMSGHAGADLKRAVSPEYLPDYLDVKGPYFEVSVRGSSEQPVLLDVAMPLDAEPWETLDLYTWSGDAWEWVGSELHTETPEGEFVRARVVDAPSSLVLVQAGPITPTISTTLEPGEPLGATHLVDEINPTGMMLTTDGNLIGDPNALLQPVTGTNYVVMPTLRNWTAGTPIVRGPLADVLSIADYQEKHIAAIMLLCTEWGFAGIDLDYRGLTVEERDAFSAFVAALADALHEQGLLLTVVVDAPIPAEGGWDTGGYDWSAIAASADGVKVPLPADPAAYDEGGNAQQLIDWAKAQVPRYKLRLLVSPLSAEPGSGEVTYISLQQALAPFGQVVNLYEQTSVEPGAETKFGLQGDLLSIAPFENAGTYQLVYRTADGGSRTVWLGTAASLAARLRLAQRYNVGGIAVADLYDPGNASGIVDTVASYRSTAVTPQGQEINVLWSVASPETTLAQETSSLTAPSFTWTATVATGTYTVKATIAGLDHGSVEITVGELPPEPVAAVGGGGVGGGSEEADCLKASFVSETVPDGTHFEKGEAFVKSWTLKNTGTCAWPSDTALVKVESETGGPESVAVGALAVDETVEISVSLTAPDGDGNFKSQWALHAGGGSIAQVWALIQAGQAPAAPVMAAAPVVGGSFELGGHVRDMALPYADKMHYAGMNWTKVQVHFGEDPTHMVNASHAQGFKIQLSGLGSPDMVTGANFNQDVANWMGAMAATGADAIEVWNEPNIDREWKGEFINPQAYTDLLCASYAAIKAANPGTLVISAAPSPTGWFGQAGGAKTTNCSDGVGCGYDDQPWLQGLAAAGAANCMDYIGAHHNAGATSPSARSGHPAGTHHSWYFMPQTELYYNIFGGQRKLFYTEMGYASQEGVPTFSDAFGWARGTTNAQQAAWLAEAVQLGSSTGMVRCIIVWNIDFSRYGYDPQDGFAIIRPGGGCPACDSLNSVLGAR